MNFQNEITKANNAIKRFAKKTYPTEKAYIKFVQSRLKDNWYVCSGMGSTFIQKVDLNNLTAEHTDIENTFAKWLDNFENDANKHFPHMLPYMCSNKRIITYKIRKQIDAIYEGVTKEYNKPSYYWLVKEGIIYDKNYAYMQYLFNGKVSKELIFKSKNLESSK